MLRWIALCIALLLLLSPVAAAEAKRCLNTRDSTRLPRPLLRRAASPRTLSCGDQYTIRKYTDESFVQLDAPLFSHDSPFRLLLRVEQRLDSCGGGQIERHFTAVDSAGHASDPSVQIIRVEPISDYRVQFPSDIEFASRAGDFWADTLRTSRDIQNWGCAAPRWSYEDSPAQLNAVGTVLTIVRTHHVRECGRAIGTDLPAQDLELLVGHDLTTAQLSVHASGQVWVNGVRLPKASSTGHWIFRQELRIVDQATIEQQLPD